MSAALSRRSLLAGLAAAPVAACSSSAERPAPVDPDVALRAAAVAREVDLVALYDALPPSPVHAALRAEHVEHLRALGSALPSVRPPHPDPQPVPAERAAAAAHAADALRASRPLAAVLASLAASEASHPVALA
ncbi:MAG: hypothetical protein LC789_05825 [Actinobacteria bacterium]|nr:hypothetical protein [Actinomycetota bacterium]